MNNNSLFCFGYGYTAQAFGRRLIESDWRVSGTTRSAEKAAVRKSPRETYCVWNDETPFSGSLLEGVSAILVSTPPNEDGCPALNEALTAIARQAGQIKWLGYLSTNGVYGDHDGAWVDESTPLKATSPRALRRIKAENDWRAFSVEHNLPLIVFRLPGIYGPGRSAIDTVRAGKARRIVKPGQVFSRMHVDDIASALLASMEKPRSHELYNLADDEPAPPQDVITYACELLGVAPPPLTPIEDANLSDMAKSFYADNKRISNKRMKDVLGVSLQYPTYREGLNALFRVL